MNLTQNLPPCWYRHYPVMDSDLAEQDVAGLTGGCVADHRRDDRGDD